LQARLAPAQLTDIKASSAKCRILQTTRACMAQRAGPDAIGRAINGRDGAGTDGDHKGYREMTANVLTFAAPAAIRIATNVYVRILIVGFALVPAFLVAYLYFYQDPTFRFEDHLFHEFAIAVATLEGLFVAYVTWQCYRTSREPLLRWLTLGFLSFVTIYVLHGAFTGFAHTHIFLFLLYGPASRVAMAILLFVGLLSYGRPPDAPSVYSTPRDWLRWIALFVLLDVAVAIIALSPIGGHPAVRLTMEGGALVFSAVNVAVMLSRRIRSPLMVVFGIAVTSFAISSAAFILAAPWNHMWWLAHAIFAMGFFVLSYGIVEAFRTTRTFSSIYIPGRTDDASGRRDQANTKRPAGVEADQSETGASRHDRSADRMRKPAPVRRAHRDRDFTLEP
jgi:hypothetical protein